ELGSGVTAKVQGASVTDGSKVPSGPMDVVLERPGFAPQTVIINGRPGAKVAVHAESWDKFLARLDLSELPAGTRVFADGEERGERVLGWPGAREVKLLLVRPGFEP